MKKEKNQTKVNIKQKNFLLEWDDKLHTNKPKKSPTFQYKQTINATVQSFGLFLIKFHYRFIPINKGIRSRKQTIYMNVHDFAGYVSPQNN